MATVRGWLEKAGFDPATGRIIHHLSSDRDCPGWEASDDILGRQQIGWDHPYLDDEFDDEGFGIPACPRFIAEDGQAVYFPYTYDGSTSLVKVWKDLSRYLQPESMTPYPGA